MKRHETRWSWSELSHRTQNRSLKGNAKNPTKGTVQNSPTITSLASFALSYPKNVQPEVWADPGSFSAAWPTAHINYLSHGSFAEFNQTTRYRLRFLSSLRPRTASLYWNWDALAHLIRDLFLLRNDAFERTVAVCVLSISFSIIT